MHQVVQIVFAIFLAYSLTGCVSIFDKLPHKKWGFIDKSGKMIIPPKFDDVTRDQYGGWTLYHKPFRNFSDGLCAVRIGNKWGYINKTGSLVVQPIYDNAGTFCDGLACVRSGTKYGYINTQGKVAIPLDFDFQRSTDNLTNNNPDWDVTQNMIEPLEFSEGLAVARKNKKSGFIDKKGNFVIDPIYENADPFYQGLASVQPVDKKPLTGRTYIDKKGKIVIQATQYCYDFAEDLFVKSNGKYDSTRRLSYFKCGDANVSLDQFDDARIFSEGLAAVAPSFNNTASGGAYGYIDKTGKMVIAPQFDISGNNLAANFAHGRAVVSKNTYESDLTGKLHGVIDTKGNWITPCKYEHISAYRDGLARAFSNQKLLYLDLKGKVFLTPNTPWGNSFSEELAAVMEP